MRLVLTPIASIAFSLLLGSAASAQSSAGYSANVYWTDDSAFLIGQITPNSAKAVESTVTLHPTIKSLHITSGGGQANAAIELTDFIRAHDI